MDIAHVDSSEKDWLNKGWMEIGKAKEQIIERGK